MKPVTLLGCLALSLVTLGIYPVYYYVTRNAICL